MDQPRNLLISNVTLNWVRVDTPTNPFGVDIYEAQIETDDSAVAAQWSADHLNVKERDGKFVVSLKRNAKKKDGSDNGKVRVVGADKMPLTKSIGNGSKGNVIVWQYPYSNAGRSGISGSLTAIQVTELVEYQSGGVDFDVVAESAPTAVESADLF